MFNICVLLCILCGDDIYSVYSLLFSDFVKLDRVWQIWEVYENIKIYVPIVEDNWSCEKKDDKICFLDDHLYTMIRI